MSVDPTAGVLSSLAEIDPYEFEHFVADLWERQGWDATVSAESRDAGKDIVVRQTEPFVQTQVIQAKRYSLSNKVSSSDIQQYASLRQQVPDADTVVVVTTGEFTHDAKQRADELNVKLVDGATLLQIINDQDAFDLVNEYTGGTESEYPEGKGPESVVDTKTESSSDSPAQDTVEDDDEMSTSEAIVAVFQGLLALGVILFILFLIARVFVL